MANPELNPAGDERLAEYYQRREIWASKPQIRLVYQRWLKKMRPYLPSGRVLEVGSGSGLTRELIPDVIMTDVVALPWIDIVADCMRLPFADQSLDGAVAFDMLHHVAEPHAFLRESARCLKPGGRLLFIEPYITLLSYLGYKALHHEDVYFGAYHKSVGADGKKADPWEGNLALPNLVFDRDMRRWNDEQPDLDIIHRERFSLFDFQLSAGFKPYSFVGPRLFEWFVKWDDRLGFLMPLLAFRIFVVIEKHA